MGKEQFISVTHFINPQLFWYHKIDVPNERYHEIIQLEQQLSELFKNKSVAERYVPKVGDVVAVNFISWNKCIRARVEAVAVYLSNTTAFIVWAIDHGFPFQTKLEHICRLPDEYAIHIDHIRCGSLAYVLPGEKDFDFMEGKSKMTTKEHWHQRACESLEKLVTDAASVTFIEHFQTKKGHFWGDLKIVSHKGYTFMASDYLVGINMAIESKLHFREFLLTLKTINIRCWLSNDGNNKFKDNVAHCTVVDRRMNTAADSCDDFSKRKVEDWHARNERVGGDRSISLATRPMDCPIGSALSIDDIGFEDSVSIKHQPLFVESVYSYGLDRVEQKGFMRLGGALTKSKFEKYSDIKPLPKPPASAFEVNMAAAATSECYDESDKFVPNSSAPSSSVAAGSAVSSRKLMLTEMRKKLASKPSDKKAQPSDESVQTISSVSNQQYQPLNESSEEISSTQHSDVPSSSGTQRSIEIRKILLAKNAEQKQALRSKSIQQEATLDTTGCGDDVQLLDTTQNSSLTEKDFNGSVVSLQSSRTKQLIEMRRKLATSSVAPTNHEKNIAVVVDSYQEKLKLNKEKQSHSDEKKQDNDNKDDILITISAGATTPYIEALRNARKKIQERKIQQLQPNKPQGFPDNNKDIFKNKCTNSNQNSSDPFDGITMLPAGFDLSRLNRYRDEENHWHRKKTTVNDVVPHDANELKELLLNTSENVNSSASSNKFNAGQSDTNESISSNANQNLSSNQNFRHTRSHTDKYKELICSESVAIYGNNIKKEKEIRKNEKPILDSSVPDIRDALDGDNIENVTEMNTIQKPILDSSVPDISEGTLNPITSGVDTSLNDNCEKERLNVTDDVLIRLNSTTNESSPNNLSTSRSSLGTCTPQTYKRRHLKSPAQQINKMDQILRRAQFEKELGDSEILDLNFSNMITKSDSDSNTGFDTVNSENETSLTSKGSNKSRINETESSSLPSNSIELNNYKANIKSESKEGSIEYQLKLERLAAQLHNELNTQHTRKAKPPKSSMIISGPQAEEIHEIYGENKLQTNFIDHLVLAHSKVPQHTLSKLSDAFFVPEIHEEMVNMRVTKMRRIQCYSWSHLLRGNSLFVVNPVKTGKTWCYMPAICSLVSYRIQNLGIPQTYGPVGIIMVASARHVENVNYYCRRLLSNSKSKVTIVPAYGVRSSNEIKIQLFNSCGILVVTPANLVRLLRDNEKEPLIDPERLQHFVIDDLDLILSRSKQDFEIAIRTICKMVKTSQQQIIPFQIVVTSRDWNSVMMSMIRYSNQPLLLIGDFLEAAVYGKVVISIKLRSTEQKLACVLHFIKQHPVEHGRLLILCSRNEELDEVVRALIGSGHPCIGYASNIGHEAHEVLTMIEEWKKEVLSIRLQILVCTDDALPDLKLQNIQNLIHYSMPTSWKKFTSRFGTLAQSYENLVLSDFHQNSLNKTAAAHSLILLDQENNMQLPHLIEFMKKHHQIQNIHPNILAVCQRLLVKREELRISEGTLLCPFILEFGECDETRCDYRHQLTRFDIITEKNDIPTSGDIRIQILKVFSPTYFTARLLEHKSSTKWNILRRSDEAALFRMRLNMHYMNMDNCIIHWPPKTNELCIYKFSETYQRARILEVSDIPHQDLIKPLRVKVKLIDLGTVITNCQSDDLLICDKQFMDFPAQAIDVRLMGIVPFDNERSWDSKATKAVQKWIMLDIKKDECVHANVNFAFDNTIWVKNVIVMERLPTVGHYIYSVNLRRSLLKKEFGVYDATVESRLLALKEDIEKNEIQQNQQEPTDQVNSKQDESINLMKFSSIDDDEFSGCEDTKMSTQEDSTEDENWDNSIENNNENLINIPLSNDKYTNIQKKPHIRISNSNIHEQDMKQTVEQWCKLPLFTLVGVEIGDEKENGQWTDIYMQRIDEHHMQKFQELNAIINNHIKSVRNLVEKTAAFDCTWLQPKQNCIVKYDNIYCRAKISGIFGKEVGKQIYRFFLCDYACFVTVKAQELFSDFLYETTSEIVEYTPYQAVHCKFAGITLDQFDKRHKVVKDYLYAYAVQERIASSQEITDLEIHSFYILLYECDKENDFSSATMFNKTLLEHNVALLDPSTQHFLEITLSVDLFSNKTDVNRETNMKNGKNNVDEVVSFEEFLEIFNNIKEMDTHEALLEGLDSEGNAKMQQAIGQTKAICQAAVERQKRDNLKVQEKLTETIKIEKLENSNLIGNQSLPEKSDEVLNTISLSNSVASTIPPLKMLHKRPETQWYQTDCLIYLAIFAPDITDYHLEVTSSSLFFAAFINQEEHVLILNFLGTVEPQNVSHEIRGLNVIVRLVKSLFMKWPRLLHQSTKYSWLKYNYNSMDMREIENIQPQQRMQLTVNGTHAKTDSDEDDADGEGNLYQTFTPIVNSEDFHDPTADIF